MKRYMVGAFAPNGMRTGDTGRRFRTRWAAERELRAYLRHTPLMVPAVVDGQVDRSLPPVALVTYRLVEL